MRTNARISTAGSVTPPVAFTVHGHGTLNTVCRTCPPNVFMWFTTKLKGFTCICFSSSHRLVHVYDRRIWVRSAEDVRRTSVLWLLPHGQVILFMQGAERTVGGQSTSPPWSDFSVATIPV